MNVTKEILEKVKCSVCENYLSMAPVYIRQTGEAVCRVCKLPDEHLTRIIQYEALASIARFPCKYWDEGCRETREFSAGAPAAHEIVCDYKQYLCPVSPSGQCEWFGQRSQIFQHCQDKHKSSVLWNSCKLKHDITKSSLNSYLLSAYDFIFLLHTKICITSGKIYHAVRVFGDPNLADKFKFTLTIQKGDLVQSKPGRVAPEGCLAMQEDSSVATGINGLLEFLDGYDGTGFQITVFNKDNIRKCQTKYCNNGIRADDTNITLCDKCHNKWATTKRNCKNSIRGCQYTDINDKCIKHETYFCRFIEICPICKTFSNSLSCHYLESHSLNSPKNMEKVDYEISSLNNSLPANSFNIDNFLPYLYHKIGLVCSEVGYLIIECTKTHCGELYIKIFSPVQYENLSKYDCVVKLFHNQSFSGKKFSVSHCSGQYDWELKISTAHFTYDSNALQFVVFCK